MPARRRQPGVRLGLDRRSGPVGSAFLVDVADDILAIDCDSADRVEVVQEIATELQGHGYRPFGLLPVGPVTNICSSPSFVELAQPSVPRARCPECLARRGCGPARAIVTPDVGLHDN